MDKLMVTMSGYRKIKKPLKEKSEEEFVLELCNIFSACCIEAAGKQQFLEFEGVERGVKGHAWAASYIWNLHGKEQDCRSEAQLR